MPHLLTSELYNKRALCVASQLCNGLMTACGSLPMLRSAQESCSSQRNTNASLFQIQQGPSCNHTKAHAHADSSTSQSSMELEVDATPSSQDIRERPRLSHI